jgi:hypothetical protein
MIRNSNPGWADSYCNTDLWFSSVYPPKQVTYFHLLNSSANVQVKFEVYNLCSLNYVLNNIRISYMCVHLMGLLLGTSWTSVSPRRHS